MIRALLFSLLLCSSAFAQLDTNDSITEIKQLRINQGEAWINNTGESMLEHLTVSEDTQNAEVIIDGTTLPRLVIKNGTVDWEFEIQADNRLSIKEESESFEPLIFRTGTSNYASGIDFKTNRITIGEDIIDINTAVAQDLVTLNLGEKDIDVEVLSDLGTSLIYFDAAAERVGLFNNTPSGAIDVGGNLIIGTDGDINTQGQLEVGTNDNVITDSSGNIIAGYLTGTIVNNLVNTANPWADNEVSDTLTIGPSSTIDPSLITGSGGVVGSGTADTVPIWTDTDTIGDSNLTYNSFDDEFRSTSRIELPDGSASDTALGFTSLTSGSGLFVDSLGWAAAYDNQTVERWFHAFGLSTSETVGTGARIFLSTNTGDNNESWSFLTQVDGDFNLKTAGTVAGLGRTAGEVAYAIDRTLLVVDQHTWRTGDTDRLTLTDSELNTLNDLDVDGQLVTGSSEIALTDATGNLLIASIEPLGVGDDNKMLIYDETAGNWVADFIQVTVDLANDVTGVLDSGNIDPSLTVNTITAGAGLTVADDITVGQGEDAASASQTITFGSTNAQTITQSHLFSHFVFSQDIQIDNGGTFLRFNETDAPTDEGLWNWAAVAGQLYFQTLEDDLTATDIFQINRTAGAIDYFRFGSVTEIQFPDGTDTDPIITNTGDTDTGLFWPVANGLGVTVGGNERVRVTPSGATFNVGGASDFDFTIKSDTVDALVMDANGSSESNGLATWQVPVFMQGGIGKMSSADGREPTVTSNVITITDEDELIILTGGTTLNGIEGGYDGQEITLQAKFGAACTLAHNVAPSGSEKKLYCASGANITLPTLTLAVLREVGGIWQVVTPRS